MPKGRMDMPPGPGRPKGVPNKVTTAVKDMLREALDKVGGAKYLAQQAKKNPGPFLALIGKLIPSEVKATIDTSDALAERLAKARARVLAASINKANKDTP